MSRQVLRTMDTCKIKLSETIWNHCALMTSYGDNSLGLHCIKYWLVACLTTPVLEPMSWLIINRFCGIHKEVVSQEISMILICKIKFQNLVQRLQVANDMDVSWFSRHITCHLGIFEGENRQLSYYCIITLPLSGRNKMSAGDKCYSSFSPRGIEGLWITWHLENTCYVMICVYLLWHIDRYHTAFHNPHTVGRVWLIVEILWHYSVNLLLCSSAWCVYPWCRFASYMWQGEF